MRRILRGCFMGVQRSDYSLITIIKPPTNKTKTPNPETLKCSKPKNPEALEVPTPNP